ncbi:MAG TPA: S8 family serine peptidase, partial [Candidatus Limnocylindria bacterium]|nr:S8 family serine peptidase [Candidatus Limnocylindria bacterium]
MSAAAATPASTTSAPATSSASLDVPVAARIIVRFEERASAAERAAVVAGVGGYVDQEIPALGLVRIAIPADASDSYADRPQIAQLIARQPGVASAELDSTVRVEFTPNDQHYATDPYVGLGQWGIRKAQVDRAWDVVRSSPMTIAVIDTGVDPGHPDLAGALLPGRTFLTSLSTGCARVENDDNSHGTHVIGIIAANANNGIGIAGVAFGSRVLPLKALDCEGSGLLSDVAQAIVYATDQGARIVSISLGSNSDSPTLRSAVQYATSRNVLVVIAAGNCGGTPLSPRCSSLNEVSYPAAYPEALAVSATASDDTRATFSTQGTYVDVAAPGLRIVSTTPTYATKVGVLSYAAFSGTSQATPFVSGLAALIWTRDPSLSAQQVRDRIVSTADDLGAVGRDDLFGAGRVNALRAVSVAPAGGYGAAYGLAGIPRTVVAG